MAERDLVDHLPQTIGGVARVGRVRDREFIMRRASQPA